MAEWLFERGIGEARAALVEKGEIIEALIEPEQRGVQAGAIVAARLRGHRIVALPDGEEALLEAHPDRVTEGAVVRVMITREALSERGKPKRAKARTVPPDTPLAPAPTLFERLAATGLPVTTIGPHDDDLLEAAGWGELIEQAQTGQVGFSHGTLQISLTPAMTLIDIDGPGPVHSVAVEGLKAAARALRRLGIAGNIGIDVPTLPDKAMRVVAAGAFAALAPQPFEATAINGFGFMQVIRPRQRASLLELCQYDCAGSAARALLRRAQRSGLSGPVALTAHAAVIAVLEANPDWLEQLARELGGAVALRGDPGLGMGAGHVHVDPAR